jgi:cobalamin biosynthesis protein CbiD
MLDVYVESGGKRLRCGYTTGTCAAIAAQAAARGLLTGTIPAQAELMTPKGILVRAEVLNARLTEAEAFCGVQKDGGDDFDDTDGLLICARVTRGGEGITVDGGDGVGRVTKPGLDQPVGAAAINSSSRRMIESAVQRVCDETGWRGGLSVLVTVPEGAEAARRTFNPHLGIVGGISILGTTGIVMPQSLRALLDSLEVEIRVLGAGGAKDVILTPGNYGADFVARYPRLAAMPQVKCANFFGDSLDFLAQNRFERVLVVAHIGKLVKLAGGIMDTHSRTADCRTELFTAHAALCGADRALCRELMDAPTSDACIVLLREAGLWDTVLSSLLEKIQEHLERRAAGAYEIGAVTFSNQYGLLGETPQGRKIIEDWSN